MAVALSGWYLGFFVAIVIVGIVVTFVGWILTLAGKIAERAKIMSNNLGMIAQSTAVIGDVPTVNAGLKDIAASCITARQVLEAKFQ